VREYTAYFDDLPSGFDGFSILHLSDFHFHGFDIRAQQLCECLSNLPSDIAVITGDFRNKAYTNWNCVLPALNRVIKTLKVRYGIFACLGNKETIGSVGILESLGISVLRNANTKIKKGGQRLYLIGVDETNPIKKFSVECVNAMWNVPAQSFKVLLAHTPDYIIFAKHFGIQLMLAGDTHGGQISLPFIGAPKVKSRLSRKYAKGWVYENGTTLYVNAGIGVVNLPVRIMCPPEIVRIVLRKGAL